MKLTPLDIHHKEFKRAIRGYNEEEVDAFLDEVAEEFERLFKENVEMRENQEALEEKMKQYENIEATLQNTLLSAQKSAEELQSNARKEAELIIRDAELKSKQMIQEAYNQQKGIRLSFERIKQAENEFRMKFKSLLKSYLSVIEETEQQDMSDLRIEAEPTPEIKVDEKIVEEGPVLEIEEPEAEEEIAQEKELAEEEYVQEEYFELPEEEAAEEDLSEIPVEEDEETEEEEVMIKISDDFANDEDKDENITLDTDEQFDDNLNLDDEDSDIDIEEIS